MSRSLITSLLAAALAFGCAATVRAAPLDDAYSRIKVAADRGDLDALESVVKQLDASGSKDEATLLAASVADYRIASVGQRDKDLHGARIDAAIRRAESRLTALTDLDASTQGAPSPRVRAEGLALLASVWGLHIGMHPLQGPFLGPKASSALVRAQTLAPNDARVVLAQGLHSMHVPTLFGGDVEQALAHFDRVVTLIPAEQASAVNWGLDDAWLWRGVALRKLHRSAEARVAFQQALAVAPDNGWARSLAGSDVSRGPRMLAN